MSRQRVRQLAHAGPIANSSSVNTSPITSPEEKRFLAGDLSPNDYLDMGQRRAEFWVRVESDRDYAGSTRRLLHVFAACASVLYLGVSLIFLIADSRSSALASAIVSLGFMAVITLYKALRRGV